MAEGCTQVPPNVPIGVPTPVGDGSQVQIYMANHIGTHAGMQAQAFTEAAGYIVEAIQATQQTWWCANAVPIWDVWLKVTPRLAPRVPQPREQDVACPEFDPGPFPVHAPIKQGQNTYLVYAMAQDPQGAEGIARTAAGNNGLIVEAVIRITPTHKCLQNLPVWEVYLNTRTLAPGQGVPGGRLRFDRPGGGRRPPLRPPLPGSPSQGDPRMIVQPGSPKGAVLGRIPVMKQVAVKVRAQDADHAEKIARAFFDDHEITYEERVDVEPLGPYAYTVTCKVVEED